MKNTITVQLLALTNKFMTIPATPELRRKMLDNLVDVNATVYHNNEVVSAPTLLALARQCRKDALILAGDLCQKEAEAFAQRAKLETKQPERIELKAGQEGCLKCALAVFHAI